MDPGSFSSLVRTKNWLYFYPSCISEFASLHFKHISPTQYYSIALTHTHLHALYSMCTRPYTHSHMYTDTHKCTYRHIMVHLPQRRHFTIFLFLPFSFFVFSEAHMQDPFFIRKHLFQLPILKFSPSTFSQL